MKRCHSEHHCPVERALASPGPTNRPQTSLLRVACSEIKRALNKKCSISSCSCDVPPVRSDSATAAAAMPITISTTRSSISVKPRARLSRVRLSAETLIVLNGGIPDTDIGILSVSAGNTIGAQGIDIVLARFTRTQVLILIAPRVSGQLFQIAALAPVTGHRGNGGPLN